MKAKEGAIIVGFTGKHISWSLHLIKLQACKLQHVFSCEYCEIFKNTYFEEYLQAAASRNSPRELKMAVEKPRETDFIILKGH